MEIQTALASSDSTPALIINYYKHVKSRDRTTSGVRCRCQYRFPRSVSNAYYMFLSRNINFHIEELICASVPFFNWYHNK
jgi:hypothetical protein